MRPRSRLHAACCTPVQSGLCARPADHEGDCDPRVAHEDGRTWELRMVSPDVDAVAKATDIALTVEYQRAERYKAALERIKTMHGQGSADRARAEAVRALHPR